jgi:hypothetical protein
VKGTVSRFLQGGLFALGFTSGLIFTLLVLISADILDLIPFEDSAFTGAIIGALVAGLIGIAGQLLMMAQSEVSAERAKKYEERVKLEKLLNRAVRTISVLAQVRTQIESSHPKDIVTLRTLAPITKPLRINDIPDRFPEDLVTVSLTLSDRKLFNLLNVLDSCLANFSWVHRLYEERVDRFMANIRNSPEMKFEDGAYSGSGTLDLRDYHEIQDIWSHYVDSAYAGLVFSKKLGDTIVGYLRSRHGVDLDFSDRISAAEWKTLFESVDVGEFALDLE